MNLNSITTDRSSTPQASPAQNGGGMSFQIAYAKVYDRQYSSVAPGSPGVAADTAPTASPEPARPAKSAHTVHAGETLTAIARARLATLGAAAGAGALREGVAQIAKANNLRNPDRIYAGQKLDLTALDAAFGRKQAAAAPAPAATALRETYSSFHDDEQMVSRYEVTPHAPWNQDEQLPAEDVQIAAVAPAPLPVALLPAVAFVVIDRPATAQLPPIDPTAVRQIALYTQNAASPAEKPAEPARGVPDIVYKGIGGKVLDALPIEPSTRASLQRANTIVSSAFTARSLGALTGFGGPLLTVAGILWGIFSSRQIEAAPAGDAKPVPDTNPVVDAKQTAQTKVADAQN